ncbi:MAG: AsnC family transcriptional regulator [Alphaproteobacteria bacterium HGW-Alphaproteobacteria-6]|nr:MAG: AsnC family transcriptional regulator [Alphaproteobacteria bacterium HGW-Alphaproteobacteria-6]
MKLDSIDLRILEALRLRKLEQAGIIAGYHARLAPRRVAAFATVLVEVTLASHRQADFDRFERAVAGIEDILACWAVGGGVDYILKLVARDIDAYQRLIDRMLAAEIGIDRYFTYIVTRTVKEDAPLPLALFAGG